MEEIKKENGSLSIEQKNDNNKIEIIFKENNGNIYSSNYNLNANNISLEDLIKKLNNNNTKIEHKGNENEVNLKFENFDTQTLKLKSGNIKKGDSIDTGSKIALNLKNGNTKTGDSEETGESAPLPEYMKTKNRDEFDKEFNEEFEKLKKEKEELIRENLELRIEIEEQKKMTDELLRVFYENRAKYYEAEKKNQQISQILKG